MSIGVKIFIFLSKLNFCVNVTFSILASIADINCVLYTFFHLKVNKVRHPHYKKSGNKKMSHP